jgi:hypothetical protein
MAHGCLFKQAKFFRDMPRHGAILADDTIPGHCSYDNNFHRGDLGDFVRITEKNIVISFCLMAE